MKVENGSAKNKLNVLSFGIAIGVAEGLYLFLFAWTGWILGYGINLIQLLAEVMPGYSPSFAGGVFGGLEGFIDGFIFGIIVSLVYNRCICKE